MCQATGQFADFISAHSQATTMVTTLALDWVEAKALATEEVGKARAQVR